MADRQRTSAARRQRLCVRALLRSLLSTHGTETAAWHQSRAADGQPWLEADGPVRPPHFSLSHSGTMVACAIDWTGPIGIDIERIRRDRPIAAIARSAFGPTECIAVEREGVETFYRLWTLREALAKASGTGFGLLMNREDLVPVTPDAGWETIDQQPWSFRYWRLMEPYGLGVVLGHAGAEAGLSPICVSGS
jgi:4'-phosphopantetheinyl transferase